MKDFFSAVSQEVSRLGRFDLLSLNVFKPNFFRQTPFRLTLVFLSVYVFVAVLVFGYIYLATSTEWRASGNLAIDARLKSLQDVDAKAGHFAVADKITSDDAEWEFVKGAFDGSGQVLAQNSRARKEGRDLPDHMIAAGLKMLNNGEDHTSVNIFSPSPNSAETCCRYQGRIVKLDDNFFIYVAMDMRDADRGFRQEVKAVVGGGLLVIILGLFAGTLINQEVTRSVQRVVNVLVQVQEGNLKARIPVRDTGDEFDALGMRINQTLERMEKTMGNLKYAGDAIAHDLRSPLSRLRSKLEVSLIDAEKDATRAPQIAQEALNKALDETDQLLRTFHTVFAISRLQAAGDAPDQVMFDATALADDMAELYELVAADKGLDFEAEIERDVKAVGNRDFLAQALANLLDNAVKYTPEGGITLRLRRTSQREIEFSVTDTGPGVPEKDRSRISERFVRLENSRTLPGVGLGLAMVEAVAVAHRGRLVIDEGPGVYKNQGPGLRTALVLPPG